MTDNRTVVIVGASLAGAKAAETVRSEGFDGRVVLIGEEADRPYERPPLSKSYLRGDEDGIRIFVHDEGFYDEHDIDLRTSTRVTAIDPTARQVVLDGGERLTYHRLLLTTGASPRRLSVPGADLPGVHYLRDVNDADRLGLAIREASRVVVVGAGWIGSEVAASARQMGADVAMVDPAQVPLAQVMGPEVGAVFRRLHVDHGVQLHLGAGVDVVVGDRAARGVRTTDGRIVEGDLVVVGIGAVPRTELAEAAGIRVGNGIEVCEYLETSISGIFAAGDVAAAWHPGLGERIRVEHWANALNQGPAAAKNMLGRVTRYDRIPYFFSDQYDFGMEYSGYARQWDRVVFRGNPDEGKFIAFWLADRRVMAGMNVNVWDVTGPIQALIRSGRPVDVDRLTDAAVPLEELVPES
ncbi:MAG TPA: FAD-dependent oxidoreductase [Acidimicrobiia bacterium]|nr:FAD-dependent oxidoreductase [Acidimicrobiia bacterium]